jgi:hypothetical protein
MAIWVRPVQPYLAPLNTRGTGRRPPVHDWPHLERLPCVGPARRAPPGTPRLLHGVRYIARQVRDCLTSTLNIGRTRHISIPVRITTLHVPFTRESLRQHYCVFANGEPVATPAASLRTYVRPPGRPAYDSVRHYDISIGPHWD